MFPVAVMAGAGWLFLFVVLLIVPPSPGPHEGGGQGARRVPPTARPAPGVADGYLVSQGAAVTVSALTALISIHGSVHIASEASLAGLLPVVEGRLRELARRIDFNQY
jgi:hypothetical protein